MYSEKDNKSVLSNELPGINSVEAVNIFEDNRDKLQEFISLIDTKEELKLFRRTIASSTSVGSSVLPKTNNIKESLTYFRSIQEMHNQLSRSLLLSKLNSSKEDQGVDKSLLPL